MLRELPWHHAAWEGRRLWENAGWTFELASANPHGEGADRPDVLLKAPCPVLLVDCSGRDAEGPDSDIHFQAVKELLHRAWPAYTEPPRIARNCEGIEKAFLERRPRIVYCFAAGSELNGGADNRPLAEVLRMAWAGHPPQVLFINLVQEGSPQAVDAIAGLHPDVPVIVLQSSPDTAALQRSTLDWLHVLLEEGEDADPVCAFHEHAVPRATV